MQEPTLSGQTLIFLTGLPRSGSTWAAQALAAALDARLVHEPFNWLNHPDRIEYHMRYLPAGSYEPKLLRVLHHVLQPRFPLAHRPARVLVKDVHACLALPVIWEHFRPHTVILVRHPCGMALSWHKLNMEVDFRLDILLAQPELRLGPLAPFVDSLRTRGDYFFSVGAYWGAAHLLLQWLAEAHPAWQWTTHEWLCLDPLRNFRQLLRRLDLAPVPVEEAQLARFLAQHNRRRRAGEGPHSTTRLTVQEPDKWRRELSGTQIASVMAGAAPFGLLERFAEQWKTS